MNNPNHQRQLQFPLDTMGQTALQHLKTVDLELAYLAILTREGLKPLSRWEKPLTGTELDVLNHLGLQTRSIRRRIRTGNGFIETIFAKTAPYLEIYAEYFDGLPVDKSAETVRIEGFLFGYPPCCVAQYIRHPYAPNEFPTHKREILFHWSCKGCIITPLLMPRYEKLYQYILQC